MADLEDEMLELARRVPNPATGSPMVPPAGQETGRGRVLRAYAESRMLDEAGRPLCPMGHRTHEWIDEVRVDLPTVHAVVDSRGVPGCTHYPSCRPVPILTALGLSADEQGSILVEAVNGLPDPTPRDVLDGAWAELRRHDTSDRGNGARIAEHAGDRARWVLSDDTSDRGGHWLVWDERAGVLRPDQEAARHMAADVGDRLAFIATQALALTADPTEQQAAWLRARAKAGAALSNTAPSTNALLWARRELAVRPEELDADPWLLNTPTGVVGLRDGYVRAHRAEYLMTRQTLARWEPGAAAPRWAAFLAEMLPDPDVRAFLQELAGYALTGDVSAAMLAVLHGDGENGKSVFTEVLRRVLGGYAIEGNPGLLVPRAKGAVPTDVLDLAGNRFVPVNETQAGVNLDEATVKTLVSAEQINARRMHQDFRRFTPTHHLFLKTNHLPQVEGRDNGIWRRLVVVPFAQRPARRDPDLTDRICAEEAEGVLAWCWDGLRRVVARGVAFDPPSAVRAASEEHKQEQLSDVEAFLTDRAVLHPDALTPTSDLQESFAAWARQQGLPGPRNSQSFGRQLRMALDSLGWTKGEPPQVWRTDNNRQRRYSGLGVRQ